MPWNTHPLAAPPEPCLHPGVDKFPFPCLLSTGVFFFSLGHYFGDLKWGQPILCHFQDPVKRHTV